MRSLIHFYKRIERALNALQSPLLLVVRVYWGFQLMTNGWGKLHHLGKITEFFASLNIPFPGINAPFVSALEFFGGILLMLGLFSRPIAFLIVCDMFVAYYTADHDALVSIVSDPGKFYIADPYTFLFAGLLILIFGAGYLSLDTLVAKRFKETA